MQHLMSEVESHACYHLTMKKRIVLDDIVRESFMQKFYFLKAMNRMHLMAIHQIVFEHLPKRGEIIGTNNLHSCLLRTFQSATTVFTPSYMLLNKDDCAHIT